MTTLELAKKKWADKMANAGAKWKKAVTDKVSVFASEMARFLGLPDISGDKKTAWTKGVNRVTAEDYQSAVSGKEARWAERLRKAFAP